MFYFQTFLAILLAIVVYVYVRIQVNKLEITRQGCNYQFPITEDVDAVDVAAAGLRWSQNTGLEPFHDQVHEVFEGDKIVVTSIAVTRIPYTNINVGWVTYIIDFKGRINSERARVSIIADELFIG